MHGERLWLLCAGSQATTQGRQAILFSQCTRHVAKGQPVWAFLSCALSTTRRNWKCTVRRGDQSVCRDCCLVEHREHIVEYSEDVAHHHKRVLDNLIARLQPHIQAITGGINSINRAEASVADKSKELCHDINFYYDNYIQALQAHRRSLLSHVSRVCEGRVKSLQSHRLQLQQILHDMQHSSNVTCRALSESNNKELLSLKPMLGRRLSGLNRVTYQCTPNVDNLLRFKAKAKAGRVNGYEVHGVLESKHLDPMKCFVRGEGKIKINPTILPYFFLSNPQL